MGVFYQQGARPMMVHINVDTAKIAALSAKNPEVLVADLVTRCPLIMGAALFQGMQRNTPGSDVQLSSLFTHPQDVSNFRNGFPLDWLDCSTKFLDCTPSTSSG